MPRKKKDKEKIESAKVSLPLSAEKPIKSWYDIVTSKESDNAKANQI